MTSAVPLLASGMLRSASCVVVFVGASAKCLIAKVGQFMVRFPNAPPCPATRAARPDRTIQLDCGQVARWIIVSFAAIRRPAARPSRRSSTSDGTFRRFDFGTCPRLDTVRLRTISGSSYGCRICKSRTIERRLLVAQRLNGRAARIEDARGDPQGLPVSKGTTV